MCFSNLNNGFYGDDLHLIRVFNSRELISVWSNSWDVDNIETPGYRPLTTYFNHIRATLFGENVVAHRLFLIALNSGYLCLLGYIYAKLGISKYFIILSGVLILTARNSAYHYGWLADGIHLVQGFLFVSSVIFLFRFFESKSYTTRILAFNFSIILTIGNILVREDSIITFPATAIILIAYLFITNRLRTKLSDLVKWCIIRRMSASDSEPCRPPIPDDGGHFLKEIGIGGRHQSESCRKK